MPTQVVGTMVAKLGGIGATTSLAGRIGANTGHMAITALQAFYMLCTAIAVHTCSTWYGVIAINTRHQFDKYSILGYFNGWLTDANSGSNAGRRAHSAHNLQALTPSIKILTAHPPEHDSSGRPTLFVCLNLMFDNVCYV